MRIWQHNYLQGLPADYRLIVSQAVAHVNTWQGLLPHSLESAIQCLLSIPNLTVVLPELCARSR